MDDLFGLVMAGGGSRRMHQDKASLPFGPNTLLEHTLNVVYQVCESVFVSCRENQWTVSEFADIERLPDGAEWAGCGPMGGIVTALQSRPGEACLVVACDMPFIDTAFLGNLIAHRDRTKCATIYTSGTEGYLEPLCAIYEPSAVPQLIASHKKRQYALHCVFEEGNVVRVATDDPQKLTNLNDKVAYQRALSLMNMTEKVNPSSL